MNAPEQTHLLLKNDNCYDCPGGGTRLLHQECPVQRNDHGEMQIMGVWKTLSDSYEWPMITLDEIDEV
ncbi:hypothetical protein RRG08_036717 [Elysia crispata]|uniref:Uncharacterized protein n=1 Tax=Elysia crispata TaxID=231223 RepID=A0AAE1CMV0_9GAST|nr:hypothetical protein RRG08_036717 [Elysia crispata]